MPDPELPAGEAPLPAVIDADSVIDANGEQVPIALVGLDIIASWVEQLSDMRRAIDTSKRFLTEEVIRRADLEAATRLGGQRRWIGVNGAASTPRFDPPALEKALKGLVRRGILSQAAIRNVVKTETVWKVDTTRVKALMKLPNVAPDIEATRLPDEKPTRKITGTGWNE